MKKYLLDTTAVIHYFNGSKEAREKIRSLGKGNVAISMATLAELYTGSMRSAKAKENLDKIAIFIAHIPALDFSKEDALEYGKLKTELLTKGKPIGDMDTIIAAQARARHYGIVTRDSDFNNTTIKLDTW